MEDVLDPITRPWDRMTDEPEIWYRIFKDYYLPLGEQRSIRNAFEFYVRVEMPLQYKELDVDNISRVPEHWNKYANEFEWGRRSLAYDESQMPDFSAIYVRQVLQFLQSNAMIAAKSLVAALGSDRTRVQAANSILNRAGVPEVSELNVKTGVSISADEMADASRKVDEWKTKKLSG